MKARMWSEFDRVRTINTGDGFVTVDKGQVVVIFVADRTEPVLSLLIAAMEKTAPLPEEP